MPRRRLMVLGAPETNEFDSGSQGLLAVFRCNDDFGVSIVASLSSFLGTLFDWSLSFLHHLRHQFVTQNSSVEAERTLQCELEEASQQLSAIQAREEQMVENAFCVLRESETSISMSDSSNQFLDVVVHFSKGSTLTSSLALRALAEPMELLLKHGELRLFIEGHQSLDEVRDLAQKRAHTINKYLQARGVARERLSIIDAGAIGEGNACVKLSVMKPLSPSILFAPCSDALSEHSRAQLSDVAALLLKVPSLQVLVEGHTDSTPMWLGNASLSESRAVRVAGELQELGVPKTQLTTCGLAETIPFSSDTGPEGCSVNRRVELHVLAGKTVASLKSLKLLGIQGHVRAKIWELLLIAAGLDVPGIAVGFRQIAGEVLRSWGLHWGSSLACLT